MGEALNTQMGEVSLEDGRTPFGKQMLKHFRFDPNFINLNQGILPHSAVTNWNFNTSQQGLSALSPTLFARNSENIKTLVNADRTHSFVMITPGSWMCLERL
jgi:hypothetical protein